MEYSIAWIDSLPVAVCLKVEKVVEKREFAVEMGIESEIQSPADEMVFTDERRECESSHALTLETVSEEGFTNSST